MTEARSDIPKATDHGRGITCALVLDQSWTVIEHLALHPQIVNQDGALVLQFFALDHDVWRRHFVNWSLVGEMVEIPVEEARKRLQRVK